MSSYGPHIRPLVGVSGGHRQSNVTSRNLDPKFQFEFRPIMQRFDAVHIYLYQTDRQTDIVAVAIGETPSSVSLSIHGVLLSLVCRPKLDKRFGQFGAKRLRSSHDLNGVELVCLVLSLDEAIAYRAVFVIASGPDGRAKWWTKRFWSQVNN